MIVELLLILPLYIGIFVVFYRFRRIIKAMTEIDNIFQDVPDTEAQRSKREFLIDLASKGKFSVAKIKEASDAEIDKFYDEYQQKELKHKAEKTGRAVGKHVVNLYSQNISRILKIDDIDQLRRDITEDPVIKESMADIGALMVCTFGKFLAPLLVVAHTANHAEGFVKKSEVEVTCENKNE